MRNHRLGTLLPAVGMFFLVAIAAAQDPSATPPAHRGPLAALPSAPGPHVAQIQELPENAWLDLGAPAPDPKWGRARGRSWTATMPLAPQLRGAFLFGEGVHGYTKPDGHYMDDLWFYDLNGQRWICCYPGADTRTLDLSINADGFETTRSGEPIPVATMGHGYEMSTFDTQLNRFMSMPNSHGYEKRALPQRQRWWKAPPEDASPWFFEAATGTWNRVRTGTPAPSSSFGDTLIYIPDRHQAFFAHRSSDVWFYDIPANRWKHVVPKGPPPPFGIDATSCYDSKRERIYIGGGSYPVAPAGANAFWIYDLKTNSWIDPQPKGAPCKGSTSYPTKNALMVYDSTNDVVLLIVHSFFDSDRGNLGVFVYDPNTNSWSSAPLPVPEKLGGNNKPKNGFYDPALNVVFLHTAGDSQDDGVIWVYRYRKGRSDVLLSCDFEDEDWWRAWGSRKQPENTSLVAGKDAFGGHGRSLRVKVPRGEHMGTTFAYRFRERLGAEPEEIYFRYYLKFDRDWAQATFGGKLPGISGTYERAGWGGRPVHGDDGWSARGLFQSKNGGASSAIGFYCYHADMRGTYGDDFVFQPRLEHGKWYCVEMYCKLNTPGPPGGRGKNDGILRGWIDGKAAFEKTNIRFRDVDSLKIEEIWVNVYHGGDTPVPKEDIHLYLDNMVIARKPIGPVPAGDEPIRSSR